MLHLVGFSAKKIKVKVNKNKSSFPEMFCKKFLSSKKHLCRSLIRVPVNFETFLKFCLQNNSKDLEYIWNLCKIKNKNIDITLHTPFLCPC